jgi:hypothetical protein
MTNPISFFFFSSAAVLTRSGPYEGCLCVVAHAQRVYYQAGFPPAPARRISYGVRSRLRGLARLQSADDQDAQVQENLAGGVGAVTGTEASTSSAADDEAAGEGATDSADGETTAEGDETTSTGGIAGASGSDAAEGGDAGGSEAATPMKGGDSNSETGATAAEEGE